MTRKTRVFKVGAVYQLISRFIAREWYITSDRQRECYLELVARALSTTDWRCLSYAIMSSHIHYVMVAGTKPLDAWIRLVHSPFADIMNKEQDRIGPIFVRGPKDLLTPPDRVGSLIAYVHNNPVRARVVAAASDSDWTSHRAYLGLAPAPRWLHVDEGLERSGFASAEEFDAWVRLEPGDPTRRRRGTSDIPEDDELAPSWTTATIPAVDPTDVICAAAAAINVSSDTLRSRRRGRVQSLGRQAVVQCADMLGVSETAIARALGISQQRVSAILMRTDDRPQVASVVEQVMVRLGGSTK